MFSGQRATKYAIRRQNRRCLISNKSPMRQLFPGLALCVLLAFAPSARCQFELDLTRSPAVSNDLLTDEELLKIDEGLPSARIAGLCPNNFFGSTAKSNYNNL